ncbi:MAG: nuclear transport factor 2 family protein, partial [Polyangiales bacterium]
MRPRTTFAVYTLLALALTASGSAARADEATEHRNKAAVQASFDAWKAGTGSPFELVADDAS